MPITVLFPGTNRKPIVMKQQFEVLNIEPDFLFGTDILPTIFPHDDFTQYMIPHASISSPPTVYHVICNDDEVNVNNVNNVNEKKNEFDEYNLNINLNNENDENINKQTYSILKKGDTPINKNKPKQKVRFNMNTMKSYDDIMMNVETAIDRELKLMQEQMQSHVDQESDEIDEDEELSNTVSEIGKIAALQAMQEYFDSHNIKTKGKWRSTAEQRANRHAQ